MTLKSSKDNAIIKIKSKQSVNHESDTMELTTSGCFYMRGNKFYIFYSENEEMGMANCNVMLIADGDTVSMKRSGEFELKLSFCPGETSGAVYYMPYGEINMTLTTHCVECSLSDAGGSVKIKYSLVMGTDEQLTEMTIKVGRKKE